MSQKENLRVPGVFEYKKRFLFCFVLFFQSLRMNWWSAGSLKIKKINLIMKQEHSKVFRELHCILHL